LKSKFEKAEKERIELRDDFKKVSIYIQNTQKLLDEQDEITKSVNAKIAETQKENIELKREKQKLQSELEIKENDSREFEKRLESCTLLIKERDERIKQFEIPSTSKQTETVELKSFSQHSIQNKI
jgi:seryl-tRNA synthetase